MLTTTTRRGDGEGRGSVRFLLVCLLSVSILQEHRVYASPVRSAKASRAIKARSVEGNSDSEALRSGGFFSFRRGLPHEASENVTKANLFWLGTALGGVHVVTGPDHVSAMMTLASGHGLRGFWLGCRWGAGHSIGLIIMYCALLAGEVHTLEGGDTAEKVVGGIMIALGCLGIRLAYKKRAQAIQDAASKGEKRVEVSAQITPGDVRLTVAEGRHDRDNEGSDDRGGAGLPRAERGGDREDAGEPGKQAVNGEEDAEREEEQPSCVSRLKAAYASVLSLFVGMLHGVAGTGGVLGVLPAVQQSDGRRGMCYLCGFTLMSILVMGCFSAVWGRISTVVKDGSRSEFWVHVGAALLSIVIGIAWLILSFLGVLGDVFG